jgi:ribosomal protein S18 acetylase RimI-like enzyme
MTLPSKTAACGRALALLACAALPARAAFLAEIPPSLGGAPLVSPAAAAPLLAPAPTAAPALAASAPVLCAPALAASAPAPAPTAAPVAFVERRGADSFGRAVLLVDALDASAPARGTVGHVDVSWRDGHASLDQPLDFDVDAAARPDGVPGTADLSHFREHLWFGLAVLPEYRRSGLGARLLDEADARLRAEGVRLLFIRATDSSVGFYRRHYGARVKHEAAEPDGEGGTYYRLEVELSAAR